MEQVQFAVAQVLDSCTQVLRQHMSLRGRIGCWLCGRYRLYWRWRTVSDRLGREEVGRRLLTTIASHEGIVPPPTSASNFGRKCSPGGHAPSGVVGVAGQAGRVRVPHRRREMPFRRGNADWAYCVVPMSRPHRLWDTGQTTLWLLTGSSAEGFVSWRGSR